MNNIKMMLVIKISPLPVNKSPLGVHQIKLVIQSSPGLSNSSGVRQHADSTLNLSQVSTGDYCWWLVVNSNLNRLTDISGSSFDGEENIYYRKGELNYS